jgi:hypothetical protein
MSESLLAAADIDKNVRSEKNDRRSEEEDRCCHPTGSKPCNQQLLLLLL